MQAVFFDLVGAAKRKAMWHDRFLKKGGRAKPWYESPVARALCFTGGAGRGSAPDVTAVLDYSHLLEEHELAATIFTKIKAHLRSRRLALHERAVDDARGIEPLCVTKKQTGEPSLSVHQTRKGWQWLSA